MKHVTFILSIKKLNKTFGNTVVLNNIYLKIPEKSIFTIVGKSGVGKSVLIKCINDIITPDSGEIWYKNTNLLNTFPHRNKNLNHLRKDFGFLFQESALLDSLTVKENIAFPIIETLKIHDNTYINTRVKELLEWVQLPHIEHKLPSELSGGMKKRVSLARTLALNPRIMFCDEPTTGLDPVTSRAIIDLIVNTTRRLGITCIIISHDIAESIRTSDYLTFLDQGKIHAYSTPEHFINNKTPLLQEFLLHSRIQIS